MALEGSHIRFALDVMDIYGISDIAKYISGTIYPDSRYFTKVDRKLTHPEHFIDGELENGDDFRKGWFVHLLYDMIQYQLILELIPDVTACGYGGQESEFWIRLCAVKNLQDMEDIKKFNIVSVLPYLDYGENPNGEDSAVMRKYNSLSQELYKNPAAIQVEDYDVLWNSLDVPDAIVSRIRQKTLEYSKNKSIVDAVGIIHGRALEIRKPLKIISFPSGVCGYRKAVRAIVVDASGNIALLNVSRHGYHKLPGGGSEGIEDDVATLKRECIEEIGCEIIVGGRVGWILEYQEKGTLRQYSFCYTGHVKGERMSPSYTEEEANSGFDPMWVSLDEAIHLLESDAPDGDTPKSIVERDLAFLLEYSKTTK